MVIFLHQRLAKLSVSLARLEFQEQFSVIIFLNGANLDKWRSAECGFFLQLSGLQRTTEQKHIPLTLPHATSAPCLRWPPHPSTTACAHTRRRLSRWPPHRVAVVLKTAPHTCARTRQNRDFSRNRDTCIAHMLAYARVRERHPRLHTHG